MSLKTWKAEFYPTEANTVQSDLEAVKHSLQKWQGLTTENLARHKIHKEKEERQTLIDGKGDSFKVDISTCALCQMHTEEGDPENVNCTQCPLFETRDGFACDNDDGEEELSPYTSFLHGSPQPMIELLQLTLDRLRE